MQHAKKHGNKTGFLLGLLLAFPFLLPAQEKERMPVNIRANYHYGALLPEYAFLNDLSQDFSSGVELNYSWQTTGKSIWERLYRYPAFGIGFYYSNLSNDAVFGKQFSLYPHYTIHIFERKNFDFNYQLGTGVTYATRKFGFTDNPENVAIGSHFNIHFHSNFEVKYRLYKNLFLNGGVAFNHLSNANLSEPNLGLNFATLFTGISYSTGDYDKRNREEVEKLAPHFEYAATVYGGMKHTRTFESFKYPAFSISFDACRRTGHKFAFGGGADFFYDTSIEIQMQRLGKSYKPQYSYTSGIHATEEFVYNRFSLLLEQGVYLGLTDKLNGHWMYNRSIARFRFMDHLYACMSMKSYFVILDFPEIGLGYHW